MADNDHTRRMNGQVKGIALSGKAGETWEKIFGQKPKYPFIKLDHVQRVGDEPEKAFMSPFDFPRRYR